MVNKPQDFLTLTGAARRARSEGYDITYHSLRNLVAAGYISHVPNGSRIYIFYPNLVHFIQKGLTAEPHPQLIRPSAPGVILMPGAFLKQV